VGAAEIEDLSAWVARGGVLVTTEVLATLSPPSPKPAQEIPRSTRPHVPPKVEGYLTQVPEEAKSLPLAREVGATFFETSWVLHPDPNAPPGGMQPLFADARGVRIAEWRIGRGRVVHLRDSSFLANGNIAEGDNAVLAANLAGYAQAQANRPRVVFNEFHFGAGGLGAGIGILALMLFTTSPGWAVLALTAAGVLFLFYQGRRFGPRRGFGQQRRRSKLEYVRAVGATYRVAGAHRLTLRLIYTWFRQQVMNRTGLTTGASNHLVAQELARRGRSPAAEYQRILDGCDRVLSQPTISPRQLTAALGQLARIEKEVLHGSGNGKPPGR
jgi:hypothetical protein